MHERPEKQVVGQKGMSVLCNFWQGCRVALSFQYVTVGYQGILFLRYSQPENQLTRKQVLFVRYIWLEKQVTLELTRKDTLLLRCSWPEKHLIITEHFEGKPWLILLYCVYKKLPAGESSLYMLMRSQRRNPSLGCCKMFHTFVADWQNKRWRRGGKKGGRHQLTCKPRSAHGHDHTETKSWREASKSPRNKRNLLHWFWSASDTHPFHAWRPFQRYVWLCWMWVISHEWVCVPGNVARISFLVRHFLELVAYMRSRHNTRHFFGMEIKKMFSQYLLTS